MRRWLIIGPGLTGLVIGILGVVLYVSRYAELDPYVPLFVEHCGDCHGDDLRGTDRGIALVDNFLPGGDTVAALIQSTRTGNPALGMPAFEGVLTELEMKGLAIFIGERRLGQRFTDFRFEPAIVIPDEVQQSELHNFTIERFAGNLDPLIFSIEPLPDGSFLVSEKERGLSIVDPGGHQSELISGLPETGGSYNVRGVHYGVGWLLDVAVHPEYQQNGWVYLHYTHLCADCGGWLPVSMNRVERARVVAHEWRDVEVVWEAPRQFYSSAPDTGAGGRLAFDDSGHVYIAVGMKGPFGPQDLDGPFGKIHRINDDGSIPADNPFVINATAVVGAVESPVRQTVWTYGHRSPQGLEWHPGRNRVWNSEMGPRGGDEINELIPGKNYGWPYHSLGLEYTGGEVARYKLQDREFDVSTVQQTLVDITPSPAISSFVFYDGEAFPAWQGDVLVTSLKGSSLFRMRFDGDRHVGTETVIKGLARIRDIEIGPDSLVYLLLESERGSEIVRLVPAP